MSSKKYLVILILLSVISFSLYSESAALVLMSLSITDEAEYNDTKVQIEKQIIKELKRQNLEYRDKSYVTSTISEMGLEGELLIEETAVYKLGKEADVPVVITVEAKEKENFLEFIIKAYDIEGNQEIASDRKVSRSSVTRYIMINSSISYVTDKITGEYGIESIIEDPKVRKITFIANQEGMKVYMPDGEYLGEIVHSILNVTDREFEIGTQLLITKKLKGHRDHEQLITLDDERSAVPLSDLIKAKTIGLEFNWTYMQLMGLGTGIRYYPIPDWMYVSFDSYFNLQKDFSASNGAETVHSDMRLLLGLYLGLGPEKIFRVSVSLGGGIILSYPLDRSGVYYDFYISPINISLELNFDDWSFYLRPEMKIALGIGDNSLHEGGIVLSDSNIPNISLGVLRKW